MSITSSGKGEQEVALDRPSNDVVTEGNNSLGVPKSMAMANEESETLLTGPRVSISYLALYYVFGNLKFGSVHHAQSMLEAFPRLLASCNGVSNNHPAVGTWNKNHRW
jgi:hypothetical protein